MKNYAKAEITDPAQVQVRCTALGLEYNNGAIFVSIPEIGLTGRNMVLCRYGLSIPYIRIQVGWKVWVEPTVEGNRRFIYTGIADCGDTVPDTNTQMLIQFLSQCIYASSAGTIHFSKKTASQPFVLGTSLQSFLTGLVSYLSSHTHEAGTLLIAPTGGGACVGTTGGPVSSPSSPSGLLSTKIFGE